MSGTAMRVYHVGRNARERALVVREVLSQLHIHPRVAFRHGDVLVSADAPSQLVIKILLNKYRPY